MKRLRSSDDDLDSYEDKASTKDSIQSRFSSRSFYHKSDNMRKGMITVPSSSRYDRDRLMDEDSRESSRMVWKRSDHDFDSFERRKGLGLGFDRYSNREGYNGSSGGERSIHRSESFGGSRREFPKGVRSDRDRSRREGSVLSWRRFGGGSKEFEESRGNVLRSSPKGLRDVRSPSWSRDSGSDQNRLSREGKRDDGRVKSSTSKSRSSPSWSKDSGSEQSRSVEVAKKSEMEVKEPEKEAKSVPSKSSSEMEEGELEPEPESVPQVKKEDQNGSEKAKKEAQEDGKMDDVAEGLQKETQGEEQVNEAEKESNEFSDSNTHNVLKKADETQNDEKNSGGNGNVSEDEVGNAGDDEGDREGKKLNECREEGSEDTVSEKLVSFEKETRKELGINLEEKVEAVEMEDTNKELTAESGGAEVNTVAAKENLNSNAKDKGKSVIVSSAEAADTAEGGAFVERKSRFIRKFGDGDDVEGPSARGFELFSRSPVRRTEKPEQSIDDKRTDGKLVLEPLDLSLSLPNVPLPIGATRDTTQAPGSPSQGRSVQSFSTLRTTSDGFTGSMSFSGSQSFFHNPSCSLTQNSFDVDNNEQSVHSRPIFQGIWQGQAPNDSTLKETPLYQKILMNGNGSLQQGISNSQAKHGNSKMSNGLERQLSFHKQLSTGQTRIQDDTKSPSHSVGSHDMGSNYSFERKLSMIDRHGSTLYRSNSQTEQQLLIGGADFVDAIISRIVSDPIHVMARKFHEMTGRSAACLKESIREIMLNPDKQGQLCAVQIALQNRSDLNLDVLLKSHRVQLEILVSLKTGLHEYLQMDSSISSSDLAEVFLNLRCKNLACRNSLPVDECDCKICVKKNGFCSACMCLVCSKFDMASNTCSWLGCDVCLHWCHADCALQESYIRNGRSTKGAPGTTEVQFYCIACDHPSEMFGFVKEVFKTFAKDWSAETFCNELEYVKRLFSVSKDIRGRQLHEIADQMLLLMVNKSNLPDVYNHVMNFLNESDSSKLNNASASTFGPKDQGNSSNGGIAGPSQDMAWHRPAYAEKSSQLERSSGLLPTFHNDLTSKQPMKLELQGAQKEPLFDELESIVRIKQAEAEMFQSRSNDARREADALKRIALAKTEKIDEEYTSRISKLRLAEAEEIRKKKFEEFQALERAHREYFSMKVRMESDIKNLLLRMEATKRNLAI